jgi:transcriptional regulator with XRE-family HTH domain
MSNLTRIHTDKTPTRIHFIPEWAEHRNLRQADIVALTGADKGLVSRWFSGKLPGQNYLEALAGIFGVDVPALFRHPDDDWIRELFRSRSEAEREKVLNLMKAMFELEDAKKSDAGKR